MHFTNTPITGAYLLNLEKRGDERGFFARVFCRNELAGLGLSTEIVQINTSLSVQQGTLRGMHYQLAPSAEVKIVRCIHGALYDVLLDLRPDSLSFGKWFGATLSAENRTMMYVPKGCAHGFLTLEPNTEAFYLVDNLYAPEMERGLRFNDPHFDIVWPATPTEVSQKDCSWPSFDPNWHGIEALRGLV